MIDAKAATQVNVPERCPVSGAVDIQPLCVVDDYTIWRCPSSATDFAWPLPSDATLAAMYSRAEWFNGGEKGGYADYDAQTTGSLEMMSGLLDRLSQGRKGLSILDVGCGYGTHLKLAADRGWSCFGIEPSEHAREVAANRYGKTIKIVERAEDLLPRRFDLIVMLDVIEHLKDPYKLFFALFGKGAIHSDSLVVISTPNARSFDAVHIPALWAYRHPPSHLIYYSAKSLEILLRRLMFTEVHVNGAVPSVMKYAQPFADENAPTNEAVAGYQGLYVEAKGSRFKEFMHERYVPGGFWKLTEYEHIPRYSFARQFATDAHVLDFGCGTGYGSASLAEVAQSVTGLDISEEAIQWARVVHKRRRLKFEQRADLGRGLPSRSFDLITCFEMIEHVNFETQCQAIENMARLLKPGGTLIISTPDPLYTAPYGDNPYHLREMTEGEFSDLLQPHFKHVKMLKQWVRPSIVIGEMSTPREVIPTAFGALNDTGGYDSLVGFVAICSNEEVKLPPYFCQFDTNSDFNLDTLHAEHRLNERSLEVTETATLNDHLESELVKRDQILAETRAWLTSQVDSSKKVEREAIVTQEWLSSQRDAWENAAKDAIAGNEWLVRERDNWERSAKDAIAGNEWLVKERDNWERTAKGLEEALTGHAWLLTQRDAWEKVAREHEQTVLTLMSYTQDLEKSRLQQSAHLATAEEQLRHIQSHWVVKVVNWLTRGKLLNTSASAK